MRIANPIYDVVFKYLMEDLEIAKSLLSIILNVEIISLEFKPQERTNQDENRMLLSRMDFKAVIKLPNGDFKIVIIELQKTKKGLEKKRFRRYLGQTYNSFEPVFDLLGDFEEESLPIIAIYILGFRLKNIKVPVLKVLRHYFDATTDKPIHEVDDFVESLSHDLYAIQIPRLNKVVKTEMEKVLDVFSQVKYKTKDNKILEYTGDSDSPVLKRMIKRLNMCLANRELINQMHLEEELEMEFLLIEKKMQKERRMKEEERRMKEEERRMKEEERRLKEEAISMLDDERKQTELLQKQIAELKKMMDEKEGRS